MLDGVHSNATKIIWGSDLWPYFIDEVASHGNSLLMIFGSVSDRQQLLQSRLESDLHSKGIKTFCLCGVEADPDANKVYEAIKLIRHQNIDSVLAVGGGSVIDTAKAVGIGAPVDYDFFDFFDGIAKPEASLPVGVLLTISGAGSESSDGSVITKEARKLSCGSPFMYPAYAYIDPNIQLTVPKHLVACGIYDSLSHVMERYFTSTDNVSTTTFLGEALFKNICRLGQKVIADLSDSHLRGDLIWAQKLAHDNTVGFGRKQCWATHTISHEIGVRTKRTHGEILSVLFPAWMTFIAREQPLQIAKFGRQVFDIDDRTTLDNQCLQTVDALKEYSRSINLATTMLELAPTLTSEYEDVAKACSTTTKSGTIGNFRRLSVDDICEILELAT